MRLSQCLFLHLIFFFKGYNTANTSHEQPCYCHDEESCALLQFKQSFTIDASASHSDRAYPKVLSWKPAQGGNSTCCCTWDGVECDEGTGHVIGLDLNSSCLYGSINSNSSLFRLVHLQRLNLADNHFNYSQIPTRIGIFPRLTYLDLSDSAFSGKLPSELSQLSKLSFLDLTSNTDSSGEGLLKLDGSNFRSLVQNLTSLQQLHLSFISISSPVPDSMANLSFLTSLSLEDCGIFDEFPITTFELQNLRILSVRFNQDLIGHVPEFNRSSPLMSLLLASTSFSGSLPSTIEKLDSLNELDVSGCSFSGVIPFSLGNLKQLNSLDLSKNRFTGPIPASLANLTQLTSLSLSINNFVGGPLSWVGKQTKLTVLDLAGVNLIGDIPSSLGNLTQLARLHLYDNQLTGPIPSWVGNLSRLVYLDLRYNKLHGSIPESLFNLRDLEVLTLHENGLTGVVDIFKVQNVTILQLGGNKLEVIAAESRTMNATVLPMFMVLGLKSCDIKEFPSFLRYQQKLLWLDLRGNKLHGKVPKWMWNTSRQTLEYLDLGNNFLTGFDQPSPVIFPWINLQILKLRFNMLYGPVPIPSSNIKYYAIGDNRLVGEISPLICNLSTLQGLDLSNNKLSGMLPQCLGNFSDELRVLDLRTNSLQGILPQTYTNNLRMFDVSYNQLHGQLPRSLANCVKLESLVLSNNEFKDDFPSWLGILPELKLLAMNHNGFYGVIENTKKNLDFPELRILDISYNNFRGEFPSEYIFSGNAMRGIAQSQPTYMKTISDLNIPGFPLFSYNFQITITNKGVERYYGQIQEDIGVVDISSNNFEGNIPEFIGNLKGLRFVNISHNSFTGSIPSVLGNLTLLEALDLSQNQLSGVIPQQLAQLTTLAYFNVSHNNLTGSIPQGPQFQTFESTSFEGNPGLCGDQLPKKCGNPKTPAPPPSSRSEEDDSGSGIEFDWKFVLAGFGSGLVVGVVLADMAITRKRELFLEIVGMLIKLIKRIRSKN